MTPRVTLFDYQEEAMKKLKTGSILWGGTGSGKSLTGIGYYYIRVCENMTKPRDLYVITTAKKRDDHEWEGECGKYGIFTDPKLSEGHVTLRVDSWNNVGKYIGVTGAFFLFDEQRVGGGKKWTRHFIRIARNNDWILLTATPGDRWINYAGVFVANGFYKNITEFKNRHVIYESYRGFPDIRGYSEERLLNRYRSQILVPMKYVKHTEQHHQRVYVDYDLERYFGVMKSRWNIFTDEPIEQASQLCYVLRRIVNEDERRIEEIQKILMDHPKVIIFYNYDYELEMLRKIDVPKAEWNGHRHEPIPEGSRWIYLVQYSAGAEGWNCTETDSMIFYSESYSYTAMVQAAGRIDRTNTAYTDLYYFHLVTRSKIDLAIARSLAGKKNFNESAFAGTNVYKNIKRIKTDDKPERLVK